MQQSERAKLLELRLRIITNLATKRYFVERSIGSLLDLEKAINLKFNVLDYPISYYDVPKLEV